MTKERDPTKEPIVRKERNGRAWAWTTDIAALFGSYGKRRHWHFMEACKKAKDDAGKEHFIPGHYTRQNGQVSDCFYVDDVGYEAMCKHMHLSNLAEPRERYRDAYRKVYDAWLKRALSKPAPEDPPEIIPDEPEMVAAPEPEPPPGPPELDAATIPDDSRALEVLSGPVHPFYFDDQTDRFPVRVIERDGEAWFVAVDACRVLDVGDTSNAVGRLDWDEKGTSTIRTPGGPQRLAVVSEPGLYRLMHTSRKPAAKRFSRWVAHDVLPAIRKTGRYESTHPDMPLDYLSALRQLVGATEQVQMLEQQKTVLSNENAALVQQTADLSAKVEEQEEWVATYRRLADPEGLILVSDFALVMHIPRGEMFDRLFKAGYIYQRETPGNRKGKWLAKVEWVRRGLFDHKVYQQPMADGTDKPRPQLYLTGKGVEVVAMLFGKDDSGQGRLSLGMH